MDHMSGINYKGNAAYHDMIINHHKLYVFGLIFYTAWQTWSLEGENRFIISTRRTFALQFSSAEPVNVNEKLRIVL